MTDPNGLMTAPDNSIGDPNVLMTALNGVMADLNVIMTTPSASMAGPNRFMTAPNGLSVSHYAREPGCYGKCERQTQYIVVSEGAARPQAKRRGSVVRASGAAEA